MSRVHRSPDPAPPRRCLDEFAVIYGLPSQPPIAPDVRSKILEQLKGYLVVSPVGIPAAVRDLWDWTRERRAPYQLRCRISSWRLWPFIQIPAAVCARAMAARRAKEARGDVAPNSDADHAAIERLELVHQVAAPALALERPQLVDADGREIA